MALNLRDLSFEVDLAFDGATGLARAESAAYDLVILDLMLPGVDGLEICRRLRAGARPYTPVLMLTSKSTELDRVLGLELGADDYVTKPFSVRELLARVKAILRRVDELKTAPRTQKTARIHFRDLVVDPTGRSVKLDDRPIALTAKEFDLLLYFITHPGRVFTRSQLLDAVWGYGHDGYEHTVNSQINRLRGKIEKDLSRPAYIRTVWGVGYKFDKWDE